MAGCGTGFAKIMLIIFNIIFWVSKYVINDNPCLILSSVCIFALFSIFLLDKALKYLLKLLIRKFDNTYTCLLDKPIGIESYQE